VETLMLAAAEPKVSVTPLRILLIGQREEDFLLIREILSRTMSNLPTELDHATSMEEASAMLGKKTYGLVLFEYATGDLASSVHSLSGLRNGGERRCRLSC
jgi:hypothetical protein